MNRHPRTLLRLTTLVLVALAPAACYRGTSRKNPFAAPGARDGEGSIRVRIENQNFNDATIHALRGGERIRLGEVTGKSEKNFTVKWNFSLPLAFEVSLVGGRGCGVRSISVDPGDQVWVRIPTEVGMSPCYAGKG